MTLATDLIQAGLKVAFQFGVKAVIASAVTAFPFLGFPVINTMFAWGVDWVAGKLQPHLEIWFCDRAIEIEVNAEKRAFARAREELRLTLAKHVKDPKELAHASDDFDRRLADLVRVRP